MPVIISCPRCQSRCQVEEKHLGAMVRCARCQEPFTARTEAPAAPPAVAGNGPPISPPNPATTTGDARPTGMEQPRPLSLERVPWAWVDRLLPIRPVAFLIAVAGIAVGCWLIGFILASNRAAFLASREWQVQPFFLAVHLICLRLFVTCYTRNFLAASRHTEMPEGDGLAWIRKILGPLGAAVSLPLAIPFCVTAVVYLFGAKYTEEAAYNGGSLGLVDWFLCLIWCAEWLLNAYIWVLLAGFSALTIWTLRKYRFRASIEVLLHEKHYRPFLLMSAQGASVVLFFGLVNAFYVWYADGDFTDYLGLGITGLFLLFGFGPPWLQLKSSVERELNQEMYRLQEKLVTRMRRRDEEKGNVTIQELGMRVDDALAILRTNYLERMHRELGRAEGKALLLKLLAPASTMAWKLIKPWMGV